MTPAQSSRIEKLIKDMWAELEASRNNQAPTRCVVRLHSNLNCNSFVSELSTEQKAEADKRNQKIGSCGRCNNTAAIGTRLTVKPIGFENLRWRDELAGALPKCKGLSFGFLPCQHICDCPKAIPAADE